MFNLFGLERIIALYMTSVAVHFFLLSVRVCLSLRSDICQWSDTNDFFNQYFQEIYSKIFLKDVFAIVQREYLIFRVHHTKNSHWRIINSMIDVSNRIDVRCEPKTVLIIFRYNYELPSNRKEEKYSTYSLASDPHETWNRAISTVLWYI